MIRLQQVLVMLAGVAAAGIMVMLGLWQLGVYQASGTQSAAHRAAEAPIPLVEAAPPGVRITDGLGRSVSLSGTYDPALQETIPLADQPDRARVLTGLRLDDGRLVVVVRGIASGSAPAPPTGRVDQVGVLLPSEDDGDPHTSIRVPLLAQSWPGQLVGGYVNLAADLSVAQGLQPSPLALPAESGRLRNGAYALQWWLFAGFALVLCGRIARDMERSHDLQLAEAEGDPQKQDSTTKDDPSETTPATT